MKGSRLVNVLVGQVVARMEVAIPLMILQKIQEAAILDIRSVQFEMTINVNK